MNKTKDHSRIARKLPAALWTFFLIAMLLGACASAASPRSDETASEAPAPAMEAPMEESAGNAFEMDSDGAGIAQSAVERIVIKNANLSIVVIDPAASMDRIGRLAEEMGGFIVTANLSQENLENGQEVPRASITVRVPAERLTEALEKIRAESDRDALRQTVDSSDVTREYTDLQSRLRNLEAAESQLAQIMSEARRTEDVLSVYNQLVQIREQIEVIKGQIQYYDESAALSAISVDLMANAAVQPLTIGQWEPQGVAKDAVQALASTLRFLANAAIWVLIYVLPVMVVLYLVFVLPLTLLIRAWRRRRTAPPAAPSAPPAPPAS